MIQSGLLYKMVIKIMNEVCLFQLIHVCIRSTLSQFHRSNFSYKYASILLVTGIYRVYAILLIWYYHIIYFPNILNVIQESWAKRKREKELIAAVNNRQVNKSVIAEYLVHSITNYWIETSRSQSTSYTKYRYRIVV